MNFEKYEVKTQVHSERNLIKRKKNLEGLLKSETNEILLRGVKEELEKINQQLEEIKKGKEQNAKLRNTKYEEFQQDLFNELGIEDNPKKELLFEKAWALGHANGFPSIFDYAEDLVDLIK